MAQFDADLDEESCALSVLYISANYVNALVV